MTTAYPIHFNLHDGTHVAVYKSAEDCYEFYLTRLNSERHNFLLRNGQTVSAYQPVSKSEIAVIAEVFYLDGIPSGLIYFNCKGGRLLTG